MQYVDFLSTSEVAKIIGCTPAWIRILAKRHADFPQPISAERTWVKWPTTHIDEIRLWMDANLMPRGLPPLRRFLAKVKWSESNLYCHPSGLEVACLEWQEAVDKDGYGRFWDGEREQKAHRWFYQYVFGELPAKLPDGQDLDLDHLCRNPACCWIGHLEPVSQFENSTMRAIGATQVAYRTDRCIADLHDLVGSNVVVRKDGCRSCRSCSHIAAAERRNRMRAEITAGTYKGSHGTYAYDVGCRCSTCVIVKSAARDKQRGRQTSSA